MSWPTSPPYFSQVNPHVSPFLRTAPTSTWLDKVETYLARRVMARTNELVRLGVFPTFYNENLTGIFTQVRGARRRSWGESTDHTLRPENRVVEIF
jgi:hypothetical protein